MSDDHSPRQREAYPELDLIAAKKAMDQAATAVCVFSLHGKTVGQLIIPDVIDDFITVDYAFSIPHLQHINEQALLKTTTANTKFDKFRRLLICPICYKSYWKLYMRSTWACASCHQLHYRRQLVDKEVVLWEQRDELSALVKRGRPKGMHNETFAKLREELFRLEWKLNNRRRKYPSEAHDLVIQKRWVTEPNVDLWSPRYTVRKSQFVRVSELD